MPSSPISDVATLKALSDPTRLAILRALMQDEMPARTVKELAAELGEPVTKLYRHVNLLESSGLIEVAESRVVSGIIERHYRARQASLYLDGNLLNPPDPQQARAVDSACFHRAHDDYLAATRGAEDTGAVLGLIEVRLTPERYAEFGQALRGLIAEFGDADDPDGQLVGLFGALYRHP